MTNKFCEPMRRRWITVSGILFSSWILIYYFLSNYYEVQSTDSPFDITLIYNWIVHRNDYQNLVQSPNTTPTLTPSEPCQNSPLLVIIVCSSLVNFIPRRAIRDTWSRDALKSGNSKVLFLVGKTNDTFINSALEEESHRYKDIIQYDFMESYHNLTLKSVLLLKWVINYCQRARYVMKVDDDVFLHVPNIIQYLSNLSKPRLLMGVKVYSAKPVKDTDSKWYMPLAEFPKPVYPDYLAGPGYVMGRHAIEILYRNSFRKPFIRMEDVYITGICSEDTGLLLEGHDMFTYTKIRNDPCLFRKMYATHRMSPDELYYIWTKVHDSSLLCYWWSQWIYWR